MNETTARKLPKVQRRAQLLETAHRIVREEGTDALTLGHLADRAGVSKPIAYEHFKSRAGLLIALYEQMDARQVSDVLAALQRTPRKLADVARVMSHAYMACYQQMGPEGHAISAALKGDEEMEAVQQRLIERYVDLYCQALSPYADLPPEDLRLRCLGIIGAGEAISRDMIHGRVDAAVAAATLATLIVNWLARKG